MKEVNYYFQGDVRVVLDDSNRLIETVQRYGQFEVTLRDNMLVLNKHGQTYTYPNTLVGFKELYQECGFNVEYNDTPHYESVIVTDHESRKAIHFDRLSGNYLSLMSRGSNGVYLKTGADGWSCTSTVGPNVETQRGEYNDLNQCPLVYANVLSEIFKTH